MKPDFDFAALDGRLVRIVLENGDVFDGECEWNSAEYSLDEVGREEESLEIDHWVFFRHDIRDVRPLLPDEQLLWQSRPMHRMRLQHEPYQAIEEGRKTVEMRLYDEKRQRIHPGDVIRFEDVTDDEEVLFAEVRELRVFKSFAELYRSLPLLDCGYTQETIAAASPSDMDRYYSPEEQQRYGVVGIRITLL